MRVVATIICSNWVRLAFAVMLSTATAAAQETPGSPNTNKADAISWLKYGIGQGSQTANRWQITIPSKATGNPISGGYATGCRFRGDFDIQVDFHLGRWPGENGVRVAMGTGAWSVMRISLGKDDFGSDKPRERYAMAFAGGGISFANASDAAGRLRITRVGSKVTGYYRRGGRWVLLRSGTATTDDSSIALGLNTTSDVFGKKTVSATFENFTINSGACVTADPRMQELSGTWKAKYNWKNTGWVTGMTVCLRQDEDNVSGKYIWSDGSKRGTLNEGKLDGNRLEYKFSGSDCSGSGHFLVTQGGASMDGPYQCPGGVGQWELTKVKTPQPDLTSVEIIAPNTLAPIDEIAIGQSFRVRLTYAKETCGGIAETVTIRTSRGLSQEVKVTGDTGDTKVIVSKPVLVVPAGTGAGRVEP